MKPRLALYRWLARKRQAVGPTIPPLPKSPRVKWACRMLGHRWKKVSMDDWIRGLGNWRCLRCGMARRCTEEPRR